MALGQKPQMIWSAILTATLFLARLPIALMVIAAAGCLGWLGLMFALRVTQFLYDRFLDHPWGQ